MKKVWIAIVVILLAGAAFLVVKNCGCCKAETEKTCCKDGEKKECQLTEEQKANIAAWEDWDNQTSEKQEELVAARKACIDSKLAEKAGKCDAEKEKCQKEEGKCPEKEAKCAEMKALWDNWDNLTIGEKKALLDEMAPKCCKKECCKKECKKECTADEKKCCKEEQKASCSDEKTAE